MLNFYEAQDKLDKLYHWGVIDDPGDPLPMRPEDEENNLS